MQGLHKPPKLRILAQESAPNRSHLVHGFSGEFEGRRKVLEPISLLGCCNVFKSDFDREKIDLMRRRNIQCTLLTLRGSELLAA